MAKYNCTVVTLEGSTIHHAFDEVRDSLTWALSSLGHQVSTTENWFSEVGETNIIFGAELIADFVRIPRNSVIYNLEQPSHPQMDKVRRLVKESQCGVWDYSLRAIDEWKAAGIAATHVPIGYTPNLTRIPHAIPDIDVAFFGWLTPRRAGLVSALRAAGLKVFASDCCYGGARDQILSRSKVCLNVHHDGRDRFEAVRVSYLMANGMCVVTEPSSDDDEYQDLRGLKVAPYRIIVDTCAAHCAVRDNTRDRELALESIRKRDFISTVASALDHATPTAPALSSSAQFKLARVEERRNFLAEARSLNYVPKASVLNIVHRDPRVASRLQSASESGDMKDFVVWMRDHAKGNIVEIGVRDGASTSAFLSGVEQHGGHVYSIDVQPCGGLFAGHPQWTFIQANSTDLAAILPQIPFEIDVLLIDGDHSRAGVLNDFQYARQVRAGGLILFHDIAPEARPSGCADMSWPGDDVKRVFEALAAALAPIGWTSETLPGRYGMGVLRKSPMTPPPTILVPESVEAK